MLAKLQIAQDSGGILGHQLSDKRPAQLLRSSAPTGAGLPLLDREGGAPLLLENSGVSTGGTGGAAGHATSTTF